MAVNSDAGGTGTSLQVRSAGLPDCCDGVVGCPLLQALLKQLARRPPHDACTTTHAPHACAAQVDLGKGNQRQRVHIMMEANWAGDRTVQQLGRRHMSNQRKRPAGSSRRWWGAWRRWAR